MYLVLNNNNFFSDKSRNLEGLGSFDVEPNLPKPKSTFSGNPVDYLKKPYPPANVNPNIRPQHNPIRLDLLTKSIKAQVINSWDISGTNKAD